MASNKALRFVSRGMACTMHANHARENNFCVSKLNSNCLKVPRRTFLPASYSYQSMWRSRLASGLLSKLRHEEFYVELRKRLDASREVSAVDMDIFANLVQDQQTFNQLVDLLAMLRKTSTAPKLLAGTHFAVIQSCIDRNDRAKLIQIIQDRAKYGIFLDFDTSSILMDKFLLQNDYLNACRIAVELMLQEKFNSHALSRSLALLSCLRYFDTIVPCLPAETATATEAVTDAAASAVVAPAADTLYQALPKIVEDDDEDADEILVYVHFIKEPFFDDHFDLRKTRKLCGKTLYMAAVSGLEPAGPRVVSDESGRLHGTAQKLPVLPRNNNDEALLNSCAILGLIMYRKFSELKQLLGTTTTETVEAKITTVLKLQSVAADIVPSRTMAVAEDLTKFVERFFAVSTEAAHTGDVADDQLSVMERPSDRFEKFCKEPGLDALTKMEILEQLKQHTNPVDGLNMLNAAENLVRDMAEAYEPIDVPLRKSQFARWMQLREDSVAQEIKKHEIETRLQAIAARRVQLVDEEEVLFFFERKSDWERMLDVQTLKEIKEKEDEEGAPYDYRVQELGYEENQMPPPSRTSLVKPYKAMQDAYDLKKLNLDLESGRLKQTRKGDVVPPIIGKGLGSL